MLAKSNIRQTTGTIALNDMEFLAFHGVDEIERKMGRTFYVSVSFNYNFEVAAIEKNLDATADYSEIYRIVKNEIGISEKLLETVARRIAWQIKNRFPKAENLLISLRKMAPFVGGKSAYAEVSYGIR